MGAVRMCMLLVLCAAVQSQTEVVPVEPGDTIVLQCPGSETAGEVDYWKVPAGTQVPVPSSEGSYVTNTTSLTIQEVEESDAGQYRCHRRGAGDGQMDAIRLAVRARPYWQKHGTSLALAVVAAGGFLLGCAAICLVHKYRYERRHKTVGAAERGGFSGAHINPALDVEAETHL